MASTYEPIATTTLSSAAASITFSSIPSTYTDLRVVLSSINSNTANMYLQFNSDTGTNYSRTYLYGDGSAAGSGRNTNLGNFALGPWNGTTTYPILTTVDIFSYAGSTYKTGLVKTDEDANGSGATTVSVNLWSSTSAITTILIGRTSGNYNTGTIATLYGIKAA